MNKKWILAAVAAVAASSALAAVTFDPATGSGFVGKGDVQLAFGWNNAMLQKNAGGVSFKYQSTTEYEAVCRFVTGEGTRGEKPHNVKHTTEVGVAGTVAYDLRQRNQITGYLLTGFNDKPVTIGGAVPVVGGPCPGHNGHDGVWSSVSDGAVTAEGGLFVSFGGNAVLLAWPTPVEAAPL